MPTKVGAVLDKIQYKYIAVKYIESDVSRYLTGLWRTVQNKIVYKGTYRKSQDKCVDDDEWGHSIYNSESSSILPAPDPTNGDLIDEVKYHNKIIYFFIY